MICCRHTVDPCLDLYFTTGKLPARCYSENVLELLHSLPGMYILSNICGSLLHYIGTSLPATKTLFMQTPSKLMCGFTLGKVITLCNLVTRPHLPTR